MRNYAITFENLSRIVRSRFAKPINVKFLVTLERPENDAIKLMTGQAKIGAYLLFVLFGDVITGKHLPVPFDFQFTDRLTHDLSPFFAPKLFKLIRLRITNLFSFANLFLIRQPPHFADVFDGDVSRHAADEPGESFRFADIAIPDLLQRYSKRLLRKILCDRLVMNDPTDDYANAIFVPA